MKKLATCTLMMGTLACGGDETPRGTTIGPAGGTVLGPNGARVVVPPGALATDTAIHIEETSAGAPALPAGFSALGQTFAFTPHGTRFAVPVTVTLPFDAAALPADARPDLFKTNAQGRWEPVGGATVDGDRLSAPITSFSYGTAGVTVTRLERSWSIHDLGDLSFHGDDSGPYESGPASCEFASTMGELSASCILGSGGFDPDDDEHALELFSNEDGVTFWTNADAVGSSTLEQTKCYSKDADDATLEYVITAATIEAVDFPDDRPDGCPTTVEELRTANFVTCSLMFAELRFAAFAEDDRRHLLRDAGGKPLLNVAGVAYLAGRAGLWDFRTAPWWNLDKEDLYPWTDANFDFLEDGGGDPRKFRPLVRLRAPIVFRVDLSRVRKNAAICVTTQLESFVDYPPGERWMGAFLRDPERTSGTTVNTTGLTPIPLMPPPPACTTEPDPASGVLQFSAAGYAVQEHPLAGNGVIVVTRTRGSTGEVSAVVTTGGGTAVPGMDYLPLTTTVFFADGDAGPRTVPIEIVGNDQAQSDRTVNVTLSPAAGCPAIGAQSTAVVTLLDDRPVEPDTFTVGGSVSGLVGTGLVLREVVTGVTVTPGNGPFTFSYDYPPGTEYEVRVETQPVDPFQVCTVTNAAGVVAASDVTNVTVTCVTTVPVDGLDPTFGDGGTVTDGAAATAMALQTDGKIVLVGGRTLSRFLPDGQRDRGFGTNGQVAIALGGPSGIARAVAVQPDGKIVVAGEARGGASSDFGVARFLDDGTPDGDFGSGGSVRIDFAGAVDQASAVLIQGDGRIVLAGNAQTPSPLGPDNDFAVARLTSGGVLDGTFGTGGRTMTNIAGKTDLGRAAALQSDGKIILAGRVADGGGEDPDVGVVRYLDDGTPDPGFGDQGIVRQNLASWDEATGVALQLDGKIVVAVNAAVGPDFHFAVARFDSSGDLDAGFGARGMATTAFSTQHDHAAGVALQADGKVVLTGQSSNLMSPDFALARFDSAGALDESFADDGRLTIDFFGAADGAAAVAIQPDGKIVVAGVAVNGTASGLGMARVLP